MILSKVNVWTLFPEWEISMKEVVKNVLLAAGSIIARIHSCSERVPLKAGHITSAEAFVAVGVLRWSCAHGLSWCLGQNAACVLGVSLLCSAAVFS